MPTSRGSRPKASSGSSGRAPPRPRSSSGSAVGSNERRRADPRDRREPYEHTGKDLFRAHGISTPAGRVCRTAQEAADAARAFGGSAVVKVQVQVGGRGKGGGIELCRSPEAAAEVAERLLHDGFMGHVVDRVLVEELLPIAQEFYTSIVLDRSRGGYLAMMTAEGGVDIETLARERPETIRRVQIDPLLGLRSYHVRELTGALPVAAREGAADVVRKLFELLWECDATLVEVNPLVVLDNVCGGITRRDVVASGVLEALTRVDATVPIVLRLDGTNAEEGRRIIDEARHPMIVSVPTMDEAAAEAARLSREAA